MVSVVLMVEKIFTKNCSDVHYFLPDIERFLIFFCDFEYSKVLNLTLIL